MAGGGLLQGADMGGQEGGGNTNGNIGDEVGNDLGHGPDDGGKKSDENLPDLPLAGLSVALALPGDCSPVLGLLLRLDVETVRL